MLKGVVLLACLLVAVTAYQSRAQLETKPDKLKDEEGCYISFLDRVVPFEQTASRPPRNDSEECLEFKCWENQVVISGCSPVDLKPPCTTTMQRDQAYPLCCPQPKCP